MKLKIAECLPFQIQHGIPTTSGPNLRNFGAASRAREQHYLKTIQKSEDIYNIHVSPSVIVEAAERSRDNGSASGSSGSN